MSIAQNRPQFSNEAAQKLAEELYGLTASACPLPSERDQNFHLKTETGQAFVLKISSAVENEAVLDFQNKVLTHLAGQPETILSPQLCPTRSGQVMTSIEGVNGTNHFVRLLTYLEGRPLAEVKPHTPKLLYTLGRAFGLMDQALQDFDHPAAQRDLQWDIKQASPVIRRHLADITSPSRRALVEQFLTYFESQVAPLLPTLRRSIIHNDGNDYNVLVNNGQSSPPTIGLIDFGDMLHTYTVCEVAIVTAYVMLHKADPLGAATQVVAGYHSIFPLTETELAVLYPLICIRLCTSVALSAYQQKLEPENEYLKISEQPAWALLEKKLRDVNPRLVHYVFREACGLEPYPHHQAVRQWLKENQDNFASLVTPNLKRDKLHIFDLSVGGLEVGLPSDEPDTEAFTARLFGRMADVGATVGIGRYNEARLCYTGEMFHSGNEETQEQRTIHLGLDVFMPAGSPIFAPLPGTVHSFRHNAAPLDYGPTLILQHEVAEGQITFFTLYGHLCKDSLEGLYEGMGVQKGQEIARIGPYPANGDWPPHLHFQIITDLLDRTGEFPGVALASQRATWLSLCPDPNLIVGIPENVFPPEPLPKNEILARRQAHLGQSLSLSYCQPLNIVRGWLQYLYDETGRVYLDAYNNVPHVGHSHPHVVQAIQKQLAVLNTNTRYLHENMVRYAERLCSLLPPPLSVCFFVNSGSEANDLALRLARTYTGQQDVIVVEAAYHGHLTTLIDLSPYKFDGPGGAGRPAHVRQVMLPDPYRGLYRTGEEKIGEKYAWHVQKTLEQMQTEGREVAAFFCESLPSVGGQIVLPDNYLRTAYNYIRQAGGVCVADEVQVGFGRVGSHWWGFELQGVVPDIVTLGKPMGNGYPLAAVVTTPDIAAAFNTGMEYFNTFAGGPVASAAGLAVLEVLEQEGLPANALRVGNYLKQELTVLMPKYPLIGDVRGAGLFLGLELVLDHETLTPAAAQAAYIANRMKEHGILLGTDGPFHNIIKIRPPLVFNEENAAFLVRTLAKILQEDFVAL